MGTAFLFQGFAFDDPHSRLRKDFLADLSRFLRLSKLIIRVGMLI